MKQAVIDGQPHRTTWESKDIATGRSVNHPAFLFHLALHQSILEMRFLQYVSHSDMSARFKILPELLPLEWCDFSKLGAQRFRIHHKCRATWHGSYIYLTQQEYSREWGPEQKILLHSSGLEQSWAIKQAHPHSQLVFCWCILRY